MSDIGRGNLLAPLERREWIERFSSMSSSVDLKARITLSCKGAVVSDKGGLLFVGFSGVRGLKESQLSRPFVRGGRNTSLQRGKKPQNCGKIEKKMSAHSARQRSVNMLKQKIEHKNTTLDQESTQS